LKVLHGKTDVFFESQGHRWGGGVPLRGTGHQPRQPTIWGERQCMGQTVRSEVLSQIPDQQNPLGGVRMVEQLPRFKESGAGWIQPGAWGRVGGVQLETSRQWAEATSFKDTALVDPRHMGSLTKRGAGQRQTRKGNAQGVDFGGSCSQSGPWVRVTYRGGESRENERPEN